jgi:7-cyano-7-deazaguanine synthase
MTTSHLILLSGGIDSACLLAESDVKGLAPEALFVDYGQAPASKERACSESIASHVGARWSSLELTGLNVVEGEIPGRNALFAHLALTQLGDREASCIYLGIHAGTPYRDCTPDFVAETQRSLDFQSGGAARIIAPYVSWSKQMIVEAARELNLPLELTYSCERAAVPCEECASCVDRRTLLASA